MRRSDLFPLLFALLSVTLVIFIFSKSSSDSEEPIPEQEDSHVSEITSNADEILIEGDSLRAQADFEQALSFYGNATSQFKQRSDWDGFTRASVKTSIVLGKMGHYEDARSGLAKILNNKLYVESIEDITLASLHSELGRMLVRLDRFDEAKIHLLQALSIVQSSENHDIILEGQTLQAFGLFYHFQGDYDRALDKYEQSFSALSMSGGPTSIEATIPLNNIANIYSRKGEYETSFRLHREILILREQFLPPNHPLLAASLGNMGNELHKLGQYENAYKMHHRAASIWTDNFGYMHPELAASYNNIGRALNALGKPEEAESFLLRALQIKEKVLGKNNFRTAITLANLGQSYLHLDQLQKAELLLNRAILIWTSRNFFSHSSYWSALRDLALVRERSSRHESAVKLLNEAYILSSYNPHPFSVKLLNDISQIQYGAATLSRKLKAVHRAIAVNTFSTITLEPGTNPSIYGALDSHELLRSFELKVSALTDLAAHLNDSDYLLYALEAIQRASDLADKLLREQFSFGTSSLLARRSEKIYGQIILLALDLYEITNEKRFLFLAFHYSEKRKSRDLTDSIAKAEAQKRAGIDSVLISKEKSFRLEINYQKRRIAEMHAKKSPDSVGVSRARNQLFEVEREYAQFLDGLATSFPKYYTLQYGNTLISTTSIQNDLLDADTALIEYVLQDSSLITFVITQDNIIVKSSQLPKDFSSSIDSLRMAIQRRYDEQYLAYAHRVYEMLVGPIESNLPTKNLIIIPEGIIHLVPFDALLPDKYVRTDTTHNFVLYSKLPYFIVDKSISYSYSATLLDQTRKRLRDSTSNELFAIAPAFPEGMELDSTAIEFLNINGVNTSDSSFAISPLPGSRDEVKEIGAILRSKESFFEQLMDSKSVILIHEDATEAAVKMNSLSSFRYLHFATHSFASSIDASLSGMLLRPGDGLNTEDGILRAGEIFALDLNAELVVLSACDTGISIQHGDDGIMGLSRGFLFAGAKNLIVSLWPSDDMGTKFLMVEFYKNLASGQEIKSALYNAKLKLIREGGLIARPRFWAPFIQIGN